MTSFASLMALSASHTRESQQAVETALQERKRREALQRKQQAEKEEKEREQERKIRMKRLEEEKRNQERARKLEEERKAREAALQRREDSQRDALRYGPKKAAKPGTPKWPTSEKRKEEEEGSGGGGLTREELRERKQQAEMRRLFASGKRSANASRGYGKSGMRLPGGAVNIVTNTGTQQTEEYTGGSVKDRLTAKPNTLVQLNMKKRDKRTEDEIQMEVRANKKVLDGSDALQFTDWFSDKKKDSPSRPSTSTPKPSQAATPVTVPTTAPQAKAPSRQPPAHRAESSLSHSKFPKINKSSSSSAGPSYSSQRPSASAQSHSHSHTHSHQRPTKRPRSPSLSESPPPPPKKRGHGSGGGGGGGMDISSEIWKIFGKDRRSYTSRDVFSDDEDMEADATALEREEKMSARIAKREEMLALEEERRHEEEKRLRKKERERAMSRGR